MATFQKMTRYDGVTVWVNFDLATSLIEQDENTLVVFDHDNHLVIKESAKAIAQQSNDASNAARRALPEEGYGLRSGVFGREM